MKQVDKIPDINLIKDEDVFEIKSTRSYYTHSFFKYPAKFIPELPNWSIRNFTKEGDIVLDCFSGSGTSLVEASVLSRNPYAIDFDTLSNILTKTKTTHLNSIILKGFSGIPIIIS